MSTAVKQRQQVRRSRPASILARAGAASLAVELRLLGFAADVHAPGDLRQHPWVRVASGLGRRAAAVEFIYVAPDDPGDEEGPWRFWWSSLRPLARLGDVAGAAKEIDRALGCPGP